MLRHAATKSTRHLKNGIQGRTIICCRPYSAAAAPSKAKRALSRAQLMGMKKKPTPSPPTSGGGSATSGSSTPPPPSPPPATGDEGSNAVPIAIGAALLGAGAYYYYNYGQESEATGEVPAATATKEEPAKTVDGDAKQDESDKTPTSIKAADGGNRVLQIEIPMKDGTRSAAPPATIVSHPEGGNRVTMESLQTGGSTTGVSTVSVRDSIKELQESIEQETSDIMKRANREIMKSFDESLFEDLDSLSPTQLRARVVQLATEMKERTRWEALRLKEFLALKEKETADKYLDVLQKQRLEFEAILARRLREQENELENQSNAKLQEKDTAVKEMIDNAIQKLDAQHEKEKKAFKERTDQEYKTKYEKVYMEKLEEFKAKAIEEMERKQQALEALNKKLKDLENTLASTQDYHEGSLQAHKLSAAALALAEKMESNKGAEAELNALRAVAGRDNVISAAVSSIPASISKGVPTLPELQARFEKVASQTRRAALVPAGQVGLEGQLAGMMFAAIKFPPKPDDPPPEDDKDAAEYIIVRARQYVQYGELEKAIQLLDKLDGQAAFTVQGWKKDASDRVAVEQALKVIKMECALLNETMSNHP